MKQEFGNCAKCPKGIENRGWLGRLFGAELQADPYCPGPTYIAQDAFAEADIQHGMSAMGITKVAVCIAEVTPEMKQASDAFERLVTEAYNSEVAVESRNAWANMTEQQRQAALDAPIHFSN